MLRRITLILSFVWIGISPFIAQSTRPATPSVTIDMRKVPLLKILSEIEEQTGIVFSYESTLLDGLPPVTFTANDEALTYCLKRLFVDLPVSYKESGNFVILKKKPRVYTISGFIRDKESQECLLNAFIYDMITQRGTNSNNYGFFSLTLPAGKILLHTSYVGFKNKEISFELQADTLLHLELIPLEALKEIVVEGNNLHSEVYNSRTSTLELSAEALRSTPALLGEADVVRAFQQTPGVSIGTEGLTGMYVRGGNNDENLFLIDGNPVYHINHLAGLFSTFNPDAIKSAVFYKGSFPARYGGRLSSIMDIRQKDGDIQKYHGNISIGLLAAKANIEGPIIKNRTSFNISFRRTYLDAFTSLAQAIYNKKNKNDQSMVGYSFYDLNVKVNHKFSDKSRIYLSFYNGQDRVRDKEETIFDLYNNDFKWRWGNRIGSTNWTYIFNNKLFGNLSLSYSCYKSNLQQETKFYQSQENADPQFIGHGREFFSSSIQDINIQTNFDYMPQAKHFIKFGSEYIFHIYQPELHRKTMSYIDDFSSRQQSLYQNPRIHGNEWAIYAEDEWKLSQRWRTNLGFRLSLFTTTGKIYHSFEPRTSLRYLIRKDWSAKLSYVKMTQYIHLLSNTYLTLPSDIWVPVTSDIPPMTSHQISAGLYYNFRKILDFSLEGYYKTMNNQIEYQDNASIFPTFSQWDKKISMGKGRAYGMEFMVRKGKGKTTGSVAYTLSWADRIFPDGSVNSGKRFPAKFDNRHKLNITVTRKFGKKIELSASWIYASGNRVSVVAGQYLTPSQSNNYLAPSPNSNMPENGYDYYYPYFYEAYNLFYNQSTTEIIARNAVRLGSYHRLDLSLNFYRPKKKGRMGIWNVSIYNAYCRLNPFSADGYLSKGEDGKYYLKQHGYIPIIPSLSYTYKF